MIIDIVPDIAADPHQTTLTIWRCRHCQTGLDLRSLTWLANKTERWALPLGVVWQSSSVAPLDDRTSWTGPTRIRPVRPHDAAWAQLGRMGGQGGLLHGPQAFCRPLCVGSADSVVGGRTTLTVWPWNRRKASVDNKIGTQYPTWRAIAAKDLDSRWLSPRWLQRAVESFKVNSTFIKQLIAGLSYKLFIAGPSNKLALDMSRNLRQTRGNQEVNPNWNRLSFTLSWWDFKVLSTVCMMKQRNRHIMDCSELRAHAKRPGVLFQWYLLNFCNIIKIII